MAGTRVDYNAECSANSRQDKVQFFCRRVRIVLHALHEILTSAGHQVVLASNRVLLVILVSIFPMDSTFAIKIAPFLLHNMQQKSS